MALLLNHLNFKQMGGAVLVTNDAGQFMFLAEPDFQTLVRDPRALPPDLVAELETRLFLTSQPRDLFASDAAQKVSIQKSYLLTGTQLFIFVLTNRCNQRCVYCQASAGLSHRMGRDMTPETGERAVELALQSPALSLSFEFQGGDPSLNFDTLSHIVRYAESRRGSKRIEYSLVTNLAAIEDAQLAFLAEHRVSITTSLDGPADLHARNRPFTDGASFESVVRNLARACRAGCSISGAIQTTTRFSLPRAKEIVDTYVDLGFDSVFIRPLTPVGVARSNWDRIGYTPQEYVDFYAEALAYIMQLASKGIHIGETHTTILLKRIFNRPTNYMELRSPCGAAIGQMAFNYDGAVFPCDEARMVAETGDLAFKLGSVEAARLVDLIESPLAKALGVASCLELLPGCADCVYLPYCGTCPVISYAQYGTLFPQKSHDYHCAVYKGMLDVIFAHLSAGSEERSVLEAWL